MNLFGFYYPPAITTLLMPLVLSGISADFAAILWCALLFAILSTALFFTLIWFPWLSLIAIIQTIAVNAVEAWYRFIWLCYPLIILLSGLFVFVHQSVRVRA